MYFLRVIVGWGWSPILIAGIALVGRIYEWPIELMASAIGGVLVVGLIVAVVGAREKQLEISASKLRQLAGYFNRRFTGNSSLSIFVAIGSLLNTENQQVWEWAHACDVSQRILNTWCNSFIDRIESDTRTGRFGINLRTYLNEMWLLNSHYYEFVEQFYEVAERIEIPAETIDQYNRFALEYNSFVQNFRDDIAELKKTARTAIEPPSVKLARELTKKKSSLPPKT